MRALFSLFALAVGLILVPFSGCAAPHGASRAGKRPNVLFLMADQLRGDFLGCSGNPAASTPNIDRLARDGANFIRAYSSTPSCTPARAAVLTGLSPWGHGMLGYHRVREQYEFELPVLFREAGWQTHQVGKNHFHPQRNPHGYEQIELDESGRVRDEGFTSDYRQWFAQVAPGVNPDATGIGWNDYRAGVYVLPEELHPTHWTADRAVTFLDQREDDRPFFMKVSFARPHSPYDPPARFLDRIDPKLVPAPFEGEWSDAQFGSIVDPKAYTAARNALPEEVALRSRRHYLASLAFVDEAIGRILDALERSGELDNTVILFTSDHGDMLGDHHLWRKTYAYEGSARIPMVLWWGSDVVELPRGQVRDEPVELRDVLPTFLEVANLAIPASVEGASMLSLLRGVESWRQWIDLEHATCYWPGNAWTALAGAKMKYIYHAYEGRESLFDIDADPGETRDLARDLRYFGELALWRARMIEHLEPRGEPWVVAGAEGADGQSGLELGVRKETILLRPRTASR